MTSPLSQFLPTLPFSGDVVPLVGEETLLMEHLLAETSPLGVTSSSGTISSGGDGAIMGEDNLFPSYLANGGSNIGVFQQESDVTSLFLPTPFPERLGLSNMAVPAALSKYDLGLEGIAQVQNFNGGGGFQSPDLCEFVEECCGYIPDFKPVFPITRENWGIKNNNQAPEAEDTSIKIGRYSVEERKDRILRYLNKRSKRNFNKTIKYACRKTLADRRVRVRGRFARNNESMCEHEMTLKNIENTQKSNGILYNNDTLQIKSDDEDWLKAAMESLVYIPYISG